MMQVNHDISATFGVHRQIMLLSRGLKALRLQHMIDRQHIDLVQTQILELQQRLKTAHEQIEELKAKK